MAREQSWSWCPSCRKWVPERLMNYDHDPDTGKLIRVCTPCLEGTAHLNNYVVEEHHEEVECVYCGSFDTAEQSPKWMWYRCSTCGETFRRM